MSTHEPQANTTDLRVTAGETLPDRPATVAATTEFRVDGPHSAAEQPAAAPDAAAPLEQQTGLQLKQLSAQLRQRQDELDARESLLNAQAAQVEQGQRTARLWLGEREAELREVSERLQREEREAHQCLDRLAAAEAALVARQRELAERAEDLGQREAALQLRAQVLGEEQNKHRALLKAFEVEREQTIDDITHQRQQIDTHREASLVLVRQLWDGLERHRATLETEVQSGAARAERPSRQAAAQRAEIRQEQQTLAARWKHLELAEAELVAERSAQGELHEQLTRRLADAEDDLRDQRRQLVAQQRQEAADLEQKRQAVQRRSEHVDQARAALEQLREELTRTHRETLEIRVATEELWVQLSGAAPAATLTRSLSRVRTQLMEEYRRVTQQNDEQRQELVAIRSELAEEHERFVRQKAQFEAWLQQRQAESAATTERLVARERQLNRREAQMAEEAHTWDVERLEYQQELRRLHKQMHDPETWLAAVEAASA